MKHAVTRSVRGSAALMDATAGAERGDSYSAPYHSGLFLAELAREPGMLRIAIVNTMRPTQFVHPECQHAVSDAANLCESPGYFVEDATGNFNRRFVSRELRQSHGITVLVALRRRILQRLKVLDRELRDDDLEPVTHFYCDYANEYSAVQIEDCRSVFHRAARSMATFQSKYDVILTPTLATPPVKHGEICMTGTSQSVLEGLLKFIPCTQMANWTGQPAMSVPLHQSQDGLPIGVQFMGRFGDEPTLFRLASQLEKAKPWSDRRPQIVQRAMPDSKEGNQTIGALLTSAGNDVRTINDT
ncbi:MAG: hypothetical protein GY878_20410 [Fuerstiella sp.]|nr:hypothetical protein [Fuerstiella sp.]